MSVVARTMQWDTFQLDHFGKRWQMSAVVNALKAPRVPKSILMVRPILRGDQPTSQSARYNELHAITKKIIDLACTPVRRGLFRPPPLLRSSGPPAPGPVVPTN